MKTTNSTNEGKSPRRIWFLAVLLLQVALLGFIAVPRSGQSANFGKDGRVNFDQLMADVLKLSKAKHHQEALDLILNALDQHKDDSLLRHLLMQTFELYLDDEVKIGQREIKADSHNVLAYNRVAGAYELLGDNFRSMEVLLTGVAINPHSKDLWMKIAKLEHKLGRDNEALDVFKEVIRLDPGCADAYNNVAFLMVQSQDCNAIDLKKAENFALKARDLDPKNAEYIDTLAEVQFKQGNHELAQRLIKEAIRLEPNKEAFRSRLKQFSSSGLPWK
jgi:tetratricopeptide (TPR) repeat protein